MTYRSTGGNPGPRRRGRKSSPRRSSPRAAAELGQTRVLWRDIWPCPLPRSPVTHWPGFRIPAPLTSAPRKGREGCHHPGHGSQHQPPSPQPRPDIRSSLAVPAAPWEALQTSSLPPRGGYRGADSRWTAAGHPGPCHAADQQPRVNKPRRMCEDRVESAPRGARLAAIQDQCQHWRKQDSAGRHVRRTRYGIPSGTGPQATLPPLRLTRPAPHALTVLSRPAALPPHAFASGHGPSWKAYLL
jgi:hypothetical protein